MTRAHELDERNSSRRSRNTIGMNITEQVANRKARITKQIDTARHNATEAQAEAARLTDDLKAAQTQSARIEALLEIGRVTEDDFKAVKRHYAEIERDHRNAAHTAEVNTVIATELQSELDEQLASGAVEAAEELERVYVPQAMELLAQALSCYRQASEAFDAAAADYQAYHRQAPRLLPMTGVEVLKVNLWGETRFDSGMQNGHDGRNQPARAPLSNLVTRMRDAGYVDLLSRYGLENADR